ncbi:SAM-dependent methyltransferase, partial [candidate division GN15 bacterium]|nr:SAM-dependent methyltransferase [candidate division GN15 bacterium]
PFVDRGEGDWMARHFFTGGIMPSADLLHSFQDDLKLRKQWEVNGTNYARTSRAWLERMREHRDEIIALFSYVYGADNARMWHGRWRIFFMACEELFAYRGGNEWFVAHYLFGKNRKAQD